MPSPAPSGDDGDDDQAHARETATKLFSALMFGWLPSIDDTGSENQSSESSTGGRTVSLKPEKGIANIESVKDNEKSVEGMRANGLQQQVIHHIENLLPNDPKELRKSTLYQEAFKALRWQRDNYLVGAEYANWRTKERLSLWDPVRSIQSFQDEILFDETTLAHRQLVKLAASFIPSATVKLTVIPLVTPLFCGPLYPTIQHSTVHLVEGQQGNLDQILKNQLMKFLSNPENRKAFKTSTKGFISTTYHE